MINFRSNFFKKIYNIEEASMFPYKMGKMVEKASDDVLVFPDIFYYFILVRCLPN